MLMLARFSAISLVIASFAAGLYWDWPAANAFGVFALSLGMALEGSLFFGLIAIWSLGYLASEILVWVTA